MRKVWPSEPTNYRYSGHFKLSHNPTALIIKEIQKKIGKLLDRK